MGSHGSTFSGNPLVCRVALAVIETLKKDKLERRAAQLGAHILSGLKQKLHAVAGVKDIRGMGLMLAVELDRPCKEIMNIALAHGLLVNVTADKVVRLLPPLILTDDEAERIASGVADVVRKFLQPAAA